MSNIEEAKEPEEFELDDEFKPYFSDEPLPAEVVEAVEKYEVVQLIARKPEGDESWSDRIFDFVTTFCSPVGEVDEDGNSKSCTCGMETLSGMTGTYDEAYAWTTAVGRDVQFIDVARAIEALADFKPIDDPKIQKAIQWARDEIEFEERWANWTPSDEDDEEELKSGEESVE